MNANHQTRKVVGSNGYTLGVADVRVSPTFEVAHGAVAKLRVDTEPGDLASGYTLNLLLYYSQA